MVSVGIIILVTVAALCVGILIGWNWGLAEGKAECEDEAVAKGYGRYVMQEKRVVFKWNPVELFWR